MFCSYYLCRYSYPDRSLVVDNLLLMFFFRVVILNFFGNVLYDKQVAPPHRIDVNKTFFRKLPQKQKLATLIQSGKGK